LLEQQAVRQALAPRLGEAQIGLMLETPLVHPHTIVSMLINDLADIDNEVFLFLDDYHLVTDPAIRRAVSFLLRHVPSHLHLVLTTRLEPPLSLGGLLAKNQLLEVDASVLRFDYSFARPISSRGACLHPPRADGTVRDV
jgi:ATP/maltotriose-dependent transcriptional regulator MalT